MSQNSTTTETEASNAPLAAHKWDVKSILSGIETSFRLSWPDFELNMKKGANTAHSQQSLAPDDEQARIGLSQLYLDRRKEESIDRLMEFFENLLDRHPAFRVCAAGVSESSSRSPTSSSSGSSSAEQSSRRVAKRTRSSDSLGGSGSDGGNNRDDKRGTKRSKANVPCFRKFACPFFQNSPGRYRGSQSCTGPGWPSIARVK